MGECQTCNGRRQVKITVNSPMGNPVPVIASCPVCGDFVPKKVEPLPSGAFCTRCGKSAEELFAQLSPEDQQEYGTAQKWAEADGTYNSEMDAFCCTECYIAVGMPSSSNGWTV